MRRMLGKAEHGNSPFLKVFHPRRHVDDAHETTQDGFWAALCEAGNDFRSAKSVCHGLRGQNDEGPIDAFIPDDSGESVLIPLLVGVANYVHGIVNIGCRRKMADQDFCGFVPELGQFQPG